VTGKARASLPDPMPLHSPSATTKGMNPVRIAALLRELADALEEGVAANDATPPTRPAKAKRPPRPFPAPLQAPNELDMMKAKQMLRRRGIT